MVRDIELPFSNHTNMSRCQLKFLLHILTKQDGDTKTKWWPDNIRFELPITNKYDISTDILIDLFKSYYKFHGDSDWLRAIMNYIENLENLTNETDFTSIDISEKILYRGVEFDIVPSLKSVKAQTGTKGKKFSILYKRKDTTFNISPAVIKHFNSNALEDKKSNIKLNLTKKKIKNLETDQDIKLCIKESHIRQMMPIASVQLYDVVKYDKKYSKEDFLFTLNLMKTDVLSKLNLLKFRKRLRNTGRDSVKSASQFDKDLSKFRSKPSKENIRDKKQKVNNKNSRMKIKEKDKPENNTIISECMIVDNIIQEDIKVNDNDTNKENITENSSSTPINTPSTPRTLPFQPKNTISENTDSVVIDLTLDESPTRIPKRENNLYQFLNMSPPVTPKPEKPEKVKQPTPKNIKRLNRHSSPLLNQKNIKSYFSPTPIKLSADFIAKKIEDLQKVCRPCFVKLDLVADLKPIRTIITQQTKHETDCKIGLSLPLATEEDICIIDLTSEEMLETIDQNKIELAQDCATKEIKSTVVHLPKNNTIRKKNFIKIKWPTKRLTL